MTPSDEVWIRADGLTKYYGSFTAIEDINFEVRRGSITAFLGPNGAGKSTTLKCLTGFLAPSTGRAFVMGCDMATHRIEGSRQLGYLGESGALYPDMSPAGYLRFVGETRNLRGRELRSAVDRVAELCQLGEVWSKPIRKLSRGFRQRVGLAQAMLHDPQVLILDEPTLGLDPNQIAVVREMIRGFAKDKAVLISTHILQEVEAMADTVMLVNEGRLKYNGPIGQLVGDETLEAKFRELTGGMAA
ncbi:MAG: ATP-binding cassette domain-containing protein [Myxococcota bacterium]|nr:ATP-binding cassette domain-containing protein [Myxococcota bacterium]